MALYALGQLIRSRESESLPTLSSLCCRRMLSVSKCILSHWYSFNSFARVSMFRSLMGFISRECQWNQPIFDCTKNKVNVSSIIHKITTFNMAPFARGISLRFRLSTSFMTTSDDFNFQQSRSHIILRSKCHIQWRIAITILRQSPWICNYNDTN